MNRTLVHRILFVIWVCCGMVHNFQLNNLPFVHDELFIRSFSASIHIFQAIPLRVNDMVGTSSEHTLHTILVYRRWWYEVDNYSNSTVMALAFRSESDMHSLSGNINSFDFKFMSHYVIGNCAPEHTVWEKLMDWMNHNESYGSKCKFNLNFDYTFNVILRTTSQNVHAWSMQLKTPSPSKTVCGPNAENSTTSSR